MDIESQISNTASAATAPTRPLRGWMVAAAIAVICVVAVVLLQTVAQGQNNGPTADITTTSGDQIFLNEDGTYRVAAAGQAVSRDLPASRGILLSPSGVDLSALSSSRASDSAAADQASPNVHIVQFETVPLLAYRQEIRALGGVDGDYIPDNALLIRMDAAVAAQVAALPWVTGITPYTADLRTNAATVDMFSVGTVEDFAIKMFDDTPGTRALVTQAVVTAGGTVTSTNQSGSVLQTSMTGAAAQSLLFHDLVQYLEHIGEIGFDTITERIYGGSAVIEAEGGYTGDGVNVHLRDGAVQVDHDTFDNQDLRIRTNGNPLASGHATGGASMLIGNGVTQPDSRGIIPDATLWFDSTDVLGLQNQVGLAAELVDPAGPRAVVSMRPFGAPVTTEYLTAAVDVDESVFNSDLLTLHSMGNWGSNNMRAPAVGKNIISVGAIGLGDPLDPADDSWASPAITNPTQYGGTGPTSDGRVKPDLHFWNEGTLTANNDNDPANGTNDYSRTAFAGTSQATISSGAYMALLFEMWADGVFEGTPGLNRDVFDARPHAATMKALAVNTAFEYGFVGAAADKNRMQQGWGRPDVSFARDLALAGNIPLIVDETDLLAPFGTNTYTVDVQPANTNCYLRTTMVYTDVAAAPSAAVHRVNDLSLRVTSPSGLIYWGNNGLAAGNDSTSGGSSNTIDTVENVFLFQPEPGTWTIEVLGDAIIEDGHPETAALDADYGLIASGDCVIDTPPPVGALTGVIWQDDNADQTSGGETAISGVEVSLIDANGTAVGVVVTNNSGQYSFADVDPGTYDVVITPATLPADLAPTFDFDGIATPNTTSVVVNPPIANIEMNFGYQLQVVSIGNRVYRDNDFSGAFSTGDTAPPGPITVQLRDPAGTVVATTTTHPGGWYLFDRVPAGSYRITIPQSETLQGGTGGAAGYDSTLGDADPDDDVDEDDNGIMHSGSGIRTLIVEVTPGAEPRGETIGAFAPTVPDVNSNLTVDIGLFPAKD